MRPTRVGRLSTLIPGIILGAFVCDGVFHFVRLDFLAFRGDEAATQAVPLGYGCCERDRCYRNDRSYGDLASIANMPEYRVFRPHVFTTDDLGFRNIPNRRHRPPSILLLGSSFTLGTGNSDEQTLARQLESCSGCSVYNAGGWNRLILPTRAFIRRLGMERGLVLLEVLERDAWDPPIAMDRRTGRVPYSDQIHWYYNQLTRSRLRIIIRWIYRKLRNDLLLPNTLKALVSVRYLKDGRPMLFPRNQAELKPPGSLERHVLAIKQLKDVLHEDGHCLAVYLIPEKLTVYGDLVRPSAPRARQGSEVLAEFEHRIRAVGIPTLNLEPLLRTRIVRSSSEKNSSTGPTIPTGTRRGFG